MLNKRAVLPLFFTGLLLGVLASHFLPPAEASRNGSGTYSLPLPPVQTGTTITATWANTTLADVKTEITNSLDRGGRGAMTQPLLCSSGTESLPGLTFDGDANTGLYRIGADNLGVTAGGVKVQDCIATGCTFPLTLGVTGAQTNAKGITVTQSTTDGAGITATGGASNGRGGVFNGDGTGEGVLSLGGDGSGDGIEGTGGAPNGFGVVGYGDGEGTGTYGLGGDSSGTGIHGVGGPPNGIGGLFSGSGTGVAVEIGTGHAKFTGGNPASDAGFTNTVTPSNIIKAWGHLITDGAGNVITNAGFNIASAVCGGAGNDNIIVTMTTGLSSANYVVVVNNPTSNSTNANISSSTAFALNTTGASCDTVASAMQFIVVGLQ
jgi:hypothetical protein